jgi:ABC-type Fe3+/spermidine/putrescine transport system ATPase subunit
LRGGVIAQVNSPSNLYRLPHDAELAQFLGEANVLEGMQRGQRVTTALGVLEVVPPDAQGTSTGRAVGQSGVDGPVSVMVRPEQLLLTDADTSGVLSVVRSYEYFGHDAVVRVRPDSVSLPELVVRMTAGAPLAPGARVGLSVHGGVVVWPAASGESRKGRGDPNVAE